MGTLLGALSQCPVFQIDLNRRHEEEIAKMKKSMETLEQIHSEAVVDLKDKLDETQLLLDDSEDLSRKMKTK